MRNYDFCNLLEPAEFESLCNDIIAKLQNIRVERFKNGKDNGIDGRIIEDGDNIIIIQSKRIKNYNDLLKSLNQEKEKVKKLSPARYILLVATELNPNQKNEIYTLFVPFIIKESDIYSANDINSILSQNADLEERHYKLWYPSTNVLLKILNNKNYNLNCFLKNKDLIDIYVKTKNYEEALKKLGRYGILIIHGNPGIGKTTLAEILILHFIHLEYEPCIIESIDEGIKLYRQNVKQIFYFDDFLGDTVLRDDKNQPSEISKFINSIKNDDTKRFILTSRTTILEDMKVRPSAERYEEGRISRKEYLIKIGDLTEKDKASILYNHIKKDKEAAHYFKDIIKSRQYWEIIKHKNYIPRLIQFITKLHEEEAVLPKDYFCHIIANLNNPTKVWEPLFNSLTEEERFIVYFIVIYSRRIEKDYLFKLFKELLTKERQKHEMDLEDNFKYCIRKLSSSFVNQIYDESLKEYFYFYFNPSIADFITYNLTDNIGRLKTILQYLDIEGILFIVRNKDKFKAIDLENVALYILKITQDTRSKLYLYNLISQNKIDVKDVQKLLMLIFTKKDYFIPTKGINITQNFIASSKLLPLLQLSYKDAAIIKSFYSNYLEGYFPLFNHYDISNLIILMKGMEEYLLEYHKIDISNQNDQFIEKMKNGLVSRYKSNLSLYDFAENVTSVDEVLSNISEDLSHLPECLRENVTHTIINDIDKNAIEEVIYEIEESKTGEDEEDNDYDEDENRSSCPTLSDKDIIDRMFQSLL